jgi:phenylpropionate dioxygenase-like ring-hydroxylating dioxygenase large terminal subunit
MSATKDIVALNDWYAVTFTGEIATGHSETTRLLGQDIVIHRDWSGSFHCVTLPENGEGGRSLQTCEKYGFLWATLGTPAREIVNIREFEGKERKFIHRGRIGVPTSGQRVIENFFDLSHFSFVHTGTLGGYDSAEVPRYSVEFREEETESLGRRRHQQYGLLRLSDSLAVHLDHLQGQPGPARQQGSDRAVHPAARRGTLHRPLVCSGVRRAEQPDAYLAFLP